MRLMMGLPGAALAAAMAGAASAQDALSITPGVYRKVLENDRMRVLEGTFRLVVGRETHFCAPGDVVWIPENTPIKYEGDKAKVFYALYPGDWRQRHGIA